MLEREISNIWNRIVFQGENPRNAIDDGTIVVNREIRKKMEEFGYIQDGKVVRHTRLLLLNGKRMDERCWKIV